MNTFDNLLNIFFFIIIHIYKKFRFSLFALHILIGTWEKKILPTSADYFVEKVKK